MVEPSLKEVAVTCAESFHQAGVVIILRMLGTWEDTHFKEPRSE